MPYRYCVCQRWWNMKILRERRKRHQVNVLLCGFVWAPRHFRISLKSEKEFLRLQSSLNLSPVPPSHSSLSHCTIVCLLIKPLPFSILLTKLDLLFHTPSQKLQKLNTLPVIIVKKLPFSYLAALAEGCLRLLHSIVGLFSYIKMWIHHVNDGIVIISWWSDVCVLGS